MTNYEIYDKLAQLKKWYSNISNRRSLESNLQDRFPDCMAGRFIYAAGNYLDPVFKGVHLKAFNEDYFASTKNQLEDLANREFSDDVNI